MFKKEYNNKQIPYKIKNTTKLQPLNWNFIDDFLLPMLCMCTVKKHNVIGFRLGCYVYVKG